MTTYIYTYVYTKINYIIIELLNKSKINKENEKNSIDDEEEIDIEEGEKYYNDKEDIFYENEEEEYYDHDIEGTETQLDNPIQLLEYRIFKNKK